VNSTERGQSGVFTQVLLFGRVLVMPRALRIEYPGAIYHVMNRGDRREPIFQDDTDREHGSENYASCP